ncbi:hypothetical protein SERLADRAFT_455490 [Serpula lacrymans var. lacrymans S7.9]|uniref:Palmitoyltransferase PFA4 n=1 Tax=Serpula lacrymans var. lacrymans (strain S7.9) TaxID=578457 RepID=F8NG26_SERL9|nr:uncharacterized protein SERLADRAFT_455490 [Serpula lacrymans var. lacrymans S7.9]EGO30996.1 hypothetical protein SERLADRAFT_455490 [Serpula lacrymans var. lacrymans S7.9]
MGRLWGRVIVSLVTGLISFLTFSPQIFIIWPWYGREITVELLTLLLPFNVLIFMLFWNYYLCITVDPGRVPDSWQPEGEIIEVKKVTGGPRYCRTCKKYKPPRSHHCRVCNRCILRMDHHCPWVNNCIGHFNYGHFIRFLFYVDLACFYHLFMVTRRVFDCMGKRRWDEPSGLELVFIVLNYALCIPVVLAVGAFSLYHIYSMLGNTTTIEGWEKDKAATLLRRGKIQEVKFPYNLGARRNITSVLGDNPLLWCCPTVTPGTGLKYQLSIGDDIDVQASWPPRDPALKEQEDKPFILPDSPWTYENGSTNPNLRPSSGARLRSNVAGKQQKTRPVYAGPPYQIDPENEEEERGLASHSRSSSQDSDFVYTEEGYRQGVQVRRGSEGYEVRPVDREELLQRFLHDQNEDVDMYQRYVPEPSSDDYSDEEEDNAGEQADGVRAAELSSGI